MKEYERALTNAGRVMRDIAMQPDPPKFELTKPAVEAPAKGGINGHFRLWLGENGLRHKRIRLTDRTILIGFHGDLDKHDFASFRIANAFLANHPQYSGYEPERINPQWALTPRKGKYGKFIRIGFRHKEAKAPKGEAVLHEAMSVERAKGEDIYSHFSRWAKMHNINVRVSGGWIRAKRAILSNYVAENEAHRGEVTDAALLFLDLHPEYVKEGYYQKQTEHKGNITIKFRKINPG